MTRSRRRRIAVVTGTRADYGLLRSTLEAIRSRRDVTLQLIVTGMHLLPRFGRTVRDIEADGFRIDARIPMQRGDDDPTDQANGLARGIGRMARFFVEKNTDLVVVLGDRIEALAAALAAVTTGRILAHIHGGDVAPGDFDEQLRHAITKLAHLHLVASEDARRRVIALGEYPARVFLVGAPGLDRIRTLRMEEVRGKTARGGIVRGNATSRKTGRGRSIGEVDGPSERDGKGGSRSVDDSGRLAPVEHASKTGTFRQGPWKVNGQKQSASSGVALVLHHPIGRSVGEERATMRLILEGVRQAGLRREIILPNTDRGHNGILRAIQEHVRQSVADTVETHASLPRDRFLFKLSEADLMIGNSSAGMIEAPAAGTPVVNVGRRQDGRLRGGPSIFDADENRTSVARAIRKALNVKVRLPASDYGNESVGPKIATILADAPLTDSLRRKRITY